MRAYNDVLRGLARERDVPLIDLEPRVPRDGSCLYDDVHFNEHGARVVAKAVADRLLPLLERMR